MVREKPDEQPDGAPEEVWGQMSDEQRAKALDLLTEIALKHVLAQTRKGEGEARDRTREPAEDTLL